jgi:O-acetyl-ADP-ribose deacetylase (regulator of RNase III)
MLQDEYQVGNSKIRIMKGDITEVETDVIVNAANSTLMGGGGVDGAIHRRGGQKILEECIQIRQTIYPDGLPTGKVVLTSGGHLKAKKVVHAVGPVWHGGTRGEPELLAQAYANSMSLFVSTGLQSIAFPSISTGAYGYPIEKASRVALKSVRDFLVGNDVVCVVLFVLFSEADLATYRSAATEVIGKSI